MAKPFSLKHDRGAPSSVAETLKHPISQELLGRGFARLAYVAKDGTPRVVPMGFAWKDGIPDESLQVGSAYKMTAQQRAEWEAGVRSPKGRPGGTVLTAMAPTPWRPTPARSVAAAPGRRRCAGTA